MVLGKKMTIFDWEWGQNSAPGDGQKIPCLAWDFFVQGSKSVRDAFPRWQKGLECFVLHLKTAVTCSDTTTSNAISKRK